MKRAFRLISDLHLEYPKQVNFVHNALDSFNTKVPILCLAGDIGNPRTNVYHEFIKIQSKYYDRVMLISGNHEYYNNATMKGIDEEIESLSVSCGNVNYLNNKCGYYNEIKFIGSTLWSHVPNEYRKRLSRTQDLSRIYIDGKKMKWKQREKLNRDAVNFIKSEINNTNDHYKCVVLTHHAPSFRLCSHPDFSGNPIEYLFLNELDYLFINPLDVWCFGHTHRRFDVVKNEVRIVNNICGFNKERKEFSDKIIQTENNVY